MSQIRSLVTKVNPGMQDKTAKIISFVIMEVIGLLASFLIIYGLNGTYVFAIAGAAISILLYATNGVLGGISGVASSIGGVVGGIAGFLTMIFSIIEVVPVLGTLVALLMRVMVYAAFYAIVIGLFILVPWIVIPVVLGVRKIAE